MFLSFCLSFLLLFVIYCLYYRLPFGNPFFLSLTGQSGTYSFTDISKRFTSRQKKMSEARIIIRVMKDRKTIQDLLILLALANRHTLIAGAIGTGKTVTL